MATQKLQVGRAFPVTIFSDDVDIPFPALSTSGTASGGSFGNILEDTGNNFIQGQINPGDIIHNISTGTADIVVGINSPTQLEVAGYSGGFAPGDTYFIYAGNNHQGCVLYIGGSGDLEVQTVGGDNVTLVGVTAGQFIPVNVMKVKESTSASNIIALW
tara:strand:+ start:3371 stop:3847 length:477 start_codon:yes stop_codon:yes gene_type:complete